jgi:nucleoside-diphosphate-sugar epimerase
VSAAETSPLAASSAWGADVVRSARERLSGKTALVTGASGFIGGRLRDALLELGADVVALRRPASPEPRRGRSVVAEYADRAGLARVLGELRPDVVFHVAGATKGVTYDDFRRANVMPTEHLLAALREAHPGVSRFVHVSSLAAYGPSAPGRPHREDAPRRPVELYGESKLEAERAVEAMGDELPWTILRPGGVYGPGDADYLELFRPIERGLNVFFGNKGLSTSMVYVDDLVRATLAAATSPAARGKGYFVCDGAPISFGELQGLLVELSGRRVVTLDLPGFFVDVAALGGELLTRVDRRPRLFNRQKATMGRHHWTCRHDALRDDVGYAPEVLLPDGLRRTLEWYRAHRWL